MVNKKNSGSIKMKLNKTNIKRFFTPATILLLISAFLFCTGYMIMHFPYTSGYSILHFIRTSSSTTYPLMFIFALSFLTALAAIITSIVLIIKLPKKKFNIILNAFVILVSLFLVLISYLYFCLNAVFGPTLPSKNEDKEITSKTLNVNIQDGKYLKRINTHAGLLGDGFYFSIIQFKPEDDISEELKNNPEWTSLPMPSELKYELGMEVDGKSLDVYFREDYGVIIPDLQNGYYFFKNKQDVPDQKDVTELSKSSSWNFITAVYDSEKHILYCFELDT